MSTQKYVIYDKQTKKFFQSQDGWFVIWSEKGLTMSEEDAEMRIMIIMKNYPGYEGRLLIELA